MPKTTKRTKELQERVAELEDALERGLKVHGVCLNQLHGSEHCTNYTNFLNVGGHGDLRRGCYVCHMRIALEKGR